MKVYAHVSLRPDGQWYVVMHSAHDWPWFQESYTAPEMTDGVLMDNLREFKERCSTFAHLRKKSLGGPISI